MINSNPFDLLHCCVGLDWTGSYCIEYNSIEDNIELWKMTYKYKNCESPLQVCKTISLIFFKHSCNHQNMYQGTLKLICTMTVEYVNYELYFYLKCT